VNARRNERPLKVVRIIDRLIYGGPTRNVVFLTEGLAKLGFECALITGVPANGEADMTFWAQQYDVEPLRIGEMSRELGPRDVVVILKLWRMFKQLRPDIIHTHKSKAGAAGRVAAFLYRYWTPSTLVGRPRKVRILHTFHGHIFHSYYGRLKTAVFIRIERALAHITDCIITVSEQQKHEIRDTFRVGLRTQFRVIPLGMDFRDAATPAGLRDQCGIGQQEFLIGAVGRLCEVKNFSLLLQAVATARRMNPSLRLHLAFIGDGHLRPGLETEAAELGISQNVTFAGFCGEIDAIYPELDIAALSSLNEGTPLALIEAMGHGRPVITTEVGGYKDILGEPVSVADGFSIWANGVSVRSGDSRGYAKALSFLVANPDLCKQMGERARHYAWQNFSRERLIWDTAALYRELWFDTPRRDASQATANAVAG